LVHDGRFVDPQTAVPERRLAATAQMLRAIHKVAKHMTPVWFTAAVEVDPALKAKYESLSALLDERSFRLCVAADAWAIGHLDTFPIVRRQDEARWERFRTRELAVAYHNAFAPGNVDAWVNG
jgi:hypothetical protein